MAKSLECTLNPAIMNQIPANMRHAARYWALQKNHVNGRDIIWISTKPEPDNDDPVCTVSAEDVIYEDAPDEDAQDDRFKELLKKSKTDLIRMLIESEKTAAAQAEYIILLERQIPKKLPEESCHRKIIEEFMTTRR